MGVPESKKQLEELINKDNVDGLYMLCANIVKVDGREGGIMAYNTLENYHEKNFDNMSDQKLDRIHDILDALTGYCANPIGEGDYHINKKQN